MVDYIRTEIEYRYKDHLLNRFQFYDPKISYSVDAEVLNNTDSYQYRFIKLRAKLDYLVIDIRYDNRIILWGSIHRFYSNGRNYTLMKFNDLVAALYKLEDKLEIPLDKIKVKNIEIGVNLFDLPFRSSSVINGLIATKVKRSNKMVSFCKHYTRSKGNYYRSERDQYVYKIYDKALKHNLSTEVLRFEIQIRKRKSINSFINVDTLKDLKSTSVGLSIIDVLCRKWNDIIVYDTNMKGQSDHLKYRNLYYWYSINDSKDKLYYHRQKLKELSRINGSNINQVILDKIAEYKPD